MAAPCIACGGTSFSAAPYPADGTPVAPIRFESIRVCSACGLGQALPEYPQKALDAFYADGRYWGDTVARDRRQVLHERNQCRHRVAAVAPLLATGDTLRVLDVGAGHGWIADQWRAALPGRALTYHFVEPDPQMSALIAARLTGARVERLPGLAQAQPGYDAIFLNHVLEHVADPPALLAALRRLLAPGGVAYIEVPHADYRFKRDVFPHTWFFTPQALHKLAARGKLAESCCETFGRLPGASALPLRVAYRAAAMANAAPLAGWLDDRLWHYRPAADGLWIRWIVRTEG